MAPRCATCSTAQHQQCFEAAGGCIVAGCEGRSTRPRAAVSVVSSPVSPDDPVRDLGMRLSESLQIALLSMRRTAPYTALILAPIALAVVTNGHAIAGFALFATAPVIWMLMQGTALVLASDERARERPVVALAGRALGAYLRSCLAALGVHVVLAFPMLMALGLIGAAIGFKSWIVGGIGFLAVMAAIPWAVYHGLMLSMAPVLAARGETSPMTLSRALVWKQPLAVFGALFVQGALANVGIQVIAGALGVLVHVVRALDGLNGLIVLVLLVLSATWANVFQALQARDLERLPA